MFIKPINSTYFLTKIPICEFQFEVNKLNHWLGNDRRGPDMSHLIRSLPARALDYCDAVYLKNPLQMAIFKQDIIYVKVLLQAGSNPLVVNVEGKDAYYFAIQTGNSTIMGLLKNYDKSKCGFCPIL